MFRPNQKVDMKMTFLQNNSLSVCPGCALEDQMSSIERDSTEEKEWWVDILNSYTIRLYHDWKPHSKLLIKLSWLSDVHSV